MHTDSAEFLLTITVMVIVFVVMVAGVLIFIYDHSATQRRFNWHQLVKDSFSVTITDLEGKSYTLDIHYNCKSQIPVYKIKGTKSLSIHLPVGFSRNQFFELVNSISGIDNQLLLIVTGIRYERVLKECLFSNEDISTYRDFKRHLLLKALRNK